MPVSDKAKNTGKFVVIMLCFAIIFFLLLPFLEDPAAVAAAGIMPAYLAHGARAHVGERGIVALAAHERLGDGERHHRVVGEKAVSGEDLKVFGAMVVKLEARAGDVADNGSV